MPPLLALPDLPSDLLLHVAAYVSRSNRPEWICSLSSCNTRLRTLLSSACSLSKERYSLLCRICVYSETPLSQMRSVCGCLRCLSTSFVLRLPRIGSDATDLFCQSVCAGNLTRVSILSLAGKDFGDRQARLLCEAVFLAGGFPYLHSLLLNNNPLSDDGVVSFTTLVALDLLPRLRHVDLSHSHLGDVSVGHIVTAAREQAARRALCAAPTSAEGSTRTLSTSLRSVHLHGTSVTEVGILFLLSSLHKREDPLFMLRSVTFSKATLYEMGEEGMAHMEDVLSSRRRDAPERRVRVLGVGERAEEVE